MAKTKKVKKEVVETVVEETVKTTEEEVATEETVVEVPQSNAYNDFKAHIEKYALQNPVKYEQKKEALLAQLNTLK